MDDSNFTPDQKLLALSLKQPYAELMLHGKIETRTWKTNYRGWVLICCSQKSYDYLKIQQICGSIQFQRVLKLIPFNLLQNNKNYLGNAIAIGRLVDCRPMVPDDEGKCFVQYDPYLFCHTYENVQAIEPFPWKGSQGWKEVNSETKKRVIIKYT